MKSHEDLSPPQQSVACGLKLRFQENVPQPKIYMWLCDFRSHHPSTQFAANRSRVLGSRIQQALPTVSLRICANTFARTGQLKFR